MKAQVKKIDFYWSKHLCWFDAHLKSWKVTILAEDFVYKTLLNPQT